MLDVHFCEYFCWVENKNIQQILSIIRKIVLNSIKNYKEKTKSKRPLSKIMLDCLLGEEKMLVVLSVDGDNYKFFLRVHSHVNLRN